MQKRMMCSKKALVGTGGFDLGFACVFDRGLDRGWGGLSPGRLRPEGLRRGLRLGHSDYFLIVL